MRELKAIISDLDAAAADVMNKRKALDEATTAQSNAFKSHEEAQLKTLELRKEVEEFLNLLVPQSMHGRVR